MTNLKFRTFPSTFNNLVDDLFTDIPVAYRNGQSNPVPVNILETGNGYTLDVFAPGFEKSDFKISLEKQLLTVSAERKAEEEDKTAKQIRKEFNVKSFKRSFTLDDKFDSDGNQAKYVNGVLTLNLPRKVEVKSTSKEISIQ